MKYTQNYNFRKPEDTDPADIQDLNYNADAIDGKIKEIEDWEAAHLQASNPHSITPALIGAETPTGAQQKANQAETNAKSYTDEEIVKHKAEIMPHRFQDLKNDKIYKFGFQINEDGNPQIIYEEVM